MKKKESKWILAADYFAERENDPEWLARNAKFEQEHQASIEKDFKDSLPLVADLAKIGLVVTHPAQLENMDYRIALPILLKWLPKIPNKHIQWCILCCLDEKWAFPITWKPLVKVFEEMEGIDMSLHWDVGSALYNLAKYNLKNPTVFEDVYRISMNRSYGKARGMVIEALSKMKNPIIPEAIASMLDDETVLLYTISAVGKLKVESARPQLEKLQFHQNPAVRKYVNIALAQLDRHAEKMRQQK